jgi:hypothetical protein
MSWEILGTIAGGFCVLGVYSFLHKENPVYRVFEHAFVGIATGIGIVFTWVTFLDPEWFRPMTGLDLKPWESYSGWMTLWILPAIFGMGIYFIYSKKNVWIARTVIGFGFGVAGGMAFRGFFNEFLPQLVDTYSRVPVVYSPVGGVQLWATAHNWLFVLTLVCVMAYFFFSIDNRRPVIREASSTGRWLLMVTFGAFFGSTIMARMALLIDRLQFLQGDWLEAWGRLFTGG